MKLDVHIKDFTYDDNKLICDKQTRNNPQNPIFRDEWIKKYNENISNSIFIRKKWVIHISNLDDSQNNCAWRKKTTTTKVII